VAPQTDVAPAPVASYDPPGIAQARAAPEESDPLAEAPTVVWYVRPPSGGQFGPATAEIMRTWIAEGRVGPDCLVWREGWREWQDAGDVFGQLDDGERELELGPVGTGGTATQAGAGHPRRSRSRSAALSATIITVLMLAVVILLGVFIWVLKGGPH
jgi:hypothetical protein